jgi:pilus assembly protein CpaB
MRKVESTTYQRTRTVVICSFALGAGLLAAWAAHEHLQRREHELENQTVELMVERIVAAEDLTAGTVIQEDQLAVRSIPQQWVQSNALEEREASGLIGQRITSDLKRGEVLLTTHLIPSRDESLSERVPVGRRAITVPASEIQVPTGLLGVDDQIDLYVSFSYQGEHVTAPLAQGVRVLALSKNIVPSTVTLEVSEQDAVKVIAARRSGTLTAMLRRRDDNGNATATAPKDLAALIGLEKSVTPTSSVIPILYGDRIDTYSIGDDAHPSSKADAMLGHVYGNVEKK